MIYRSLEWLTRDDCIFDELKAYVGSIAPRLGNMKGDYLVVDVGSKTTDVVYLNKGIPVERQCMTIERAMVKWLRQVQGAYTWSRYGRLSAGNWLPRVLPWLERLRG